MSREKFEKLCEEHGISFDYLPQYKKDGVVIPFSIWIDAPEGKVFTSSGLSIDGSINGGSTDDLEKVDWKKNVKALKEIIDLGFEDVSNEEEIIKLGVPKTFGELEKESTDGFVNPTLTPEQEAELQRKIKIKGDAERASLIAQGIDPDATESDNEEEDEE